MKINPFKKQRTFTVVGINNSGKTVFLSSLIHHLTQHNLHTSPMVVGCERDAASSFPATPYWEGINEKGTWPPKTLESSQTTCWFHLDQKKALNRKVALTFNDVPGERIADTLIYKHSSYEEWSKDFMRDLRSNIRADLVEPFSKVFLQLGSLDEIKAEFKKMLAGFVLDQRYAEISPSSFVLHVDLADDGRIKSGSNIKPLSEFSDKEKWIFYCQGERFSGFPGQEFFPLPQKMLDADKELRKEMQSNYRAYRKKVVEPVFNMIRDSHGLIMLVDVADCLAQGPQFKKTCFSIVEKVVKLARSDNLRIWAEKRVRKLGHMSSVPEVDRIAYVATKHDLVLPTDRDNLAALLDKERRRLNRVSGDKMKTETFTCAAVVAAKKHLDGGKVEYLARDEVTNKLVEHSCHPSSVPRLWPDSTSWGEFLFLAPPPNVKWKEEQEGLEEIFNFLFDSSGSGIAGKIVKKIKRKV